MQALNIFHVLIAISMVALVLVQRGPGATAGAAFGSGASGTVFGSRGAGSFLTRSTWVLGAAFCLISLTMAVVVSRNVASPETDLGVVGTTPPAVEETIPEIPSAIPMPGEAETDLPVIDAGEEPAGDLPVIESGSDEEGAGTAGDSGDPSDSGN